MCTADGRAVIGSELHPTVRSLRADHEHELFVTRLFPDSTFAVSCNPIPRNALCDDLHESMSLGK